MYVWQFGIYFRINEKNGKLTLDEYNVISVIYETCDRDLYSDKKYLFNFIIKNYI